jgi:hypothetical protein
LAKTNTPKQGDDAPRSRAAGALRQASIPYSSDATRGSSSAARLRWWGIAAAALSAGSMLLAAGLATDGQKISIQKFLVFASASVPLGCLSAVMLFSSSRQMAAATEALRVSRQLLVLDAYVSSLPRNARALVLASLAPRFFPQHLRAEDEMLLDHSYPPSDQLLAAIDPDTYAAFTGEEFDDIANQDSEG